MNVLHKFEIVNPRKYLQLGAYIDKRISDLIISFKFLIITARHFPIDYIIDKIIRMAYHHCLNNTAPSLKWPP